MSRTPHLCTTQSHLSSECQKTVTTGWFKTQHVLHFLVGPKWGGPRQISDIWAPRPEFPACHNVQDRSQGIEDLKSVLSAQVHTTGSRVVPELTCCCTKNVFKTSKNWTNWTTLKNRSGKKLEVDCKFGETFHEPNVFFPFANRLRQIPLVPWDAEALPWWCPIPNSSSSSPPGVEISPGISNWKSSVFFLWRYSNYSNYSMGMDIAWILHDIADQSKIWYFGKGPTWPNNGCSIF